MASSKKNDASLVDSEAEVSGPFPSAWHALGDLDANAMVAKANMVRALDSTIIARGLTQAAAAELLGIAQPNLSRILSGHFRSVTMDQLVKHLVALGANVRVTIVPPVAEDSRGILVVDGPMPAASAKRIGRPRSRA